MLDLERPFLISPPFGSYFSYRRAYSVLGSFTRWPRPGRTVQVLRTVRPVPGGWINKIGLRNGGALKASDVLQSSASKAEIVSIALIDGDEAEWDWVCGFLDMHRIGDLIVELNVSCPNTEHPMPALPTTAQATRLAAQPNLTVIWKLPPIEYAVKKAFDHLVPYAKMRYVHLSNTLPSPIGGISGTAQREVNLKLVENVIVWWGNAALPEIIAGGGIYTPEHLRQYRDAGATRFSLATAWFWPPRALKVMRNYP